MSTQISNEKNLRIKNLIFKNGEKTEKENFSVDCKNVVILVGPNNSGKSTTLRELQRFCLNDGNLKLKVLSKINFELPDSDEKIKKLYEEFQTKDLPRNIELIGNEIGLAFPDILGKGEQAEYSKLDPDGFLAQVQAGNVEYLRTKVPFLKNYSIILDGRTRFTLLNNKPRGDLTLAPANPLSKLYVDGDLIKKLDEIIFKEFNLHVYIDPTPSSGLLKIVLNQHDFGDRRSLDEKAINFFKSCSEITTFGDGLQVYVGLLIAVMSLQHKIILLDEPEAFLHPPKARSLGSQMTTFANEREGSLIVSTHSPEFLLGCLDKSTEVTIIRLTYDQSKGTTRHLLPGDVKSLTTDPLLRSSETVGALFHSSAIVTEAHRDRVFYHEINRRMSIESKGIDDVQFLNTQGKHTIHRIFSPLRKAGIPTVALYDLDIIKKENLPNEETTLWKKIMEYANVPADEINSLDEKRQILQDSLQPKTSDSLNPFKKKGISLLEGDEKVQAEDFLKEVQKYGIFIVPTGDLESWTEDLVGESFEKTIWLVNMLEKLEELDPKPKNQGIWEFVSKIKEWIENSDRLGM